MGRDPAFLYYDGDASRDVAHMNRLERGCYLDIIHFQKKFGRFTMEQARKILGKDFEECWESVELVLSKEDGRFFIGWVDESISKRKVYAEKQRKRIQEYWDKKKKSRKNVGNTVVLPYEIVNENVNENKNKNLIKNNLVVNRHYNIAVINNIILYWNEKMPFKIKTLSDTRRKKLNALLKKKDFDWKKIIDKMSVSDFLLGKVESKNFPNFRGDLDWLIKNDTNYIKVLEGKYDNKKADPLARWRV